MTTSSFFMLESSSARPGVSLNRRGTGIACLEAVLDDGELYIDPRLLLALSGTVTIAPAPSGYLVCARGTGQVTLTAADTLANQAHLFAASRPGRTRDIHMVLLLEGQAVYLMPDLLLAASPLPEIRPARGAHGRDLLMVRAPADETILLAFSAAGRSLLVELGHGEALDVPPTALLIADSTLDLAECEDEAAGRSLRFVQCLGPGCCVLQYG